MNAPMPDAFTVIGWKLGLQIALWAIVALVALALILLAIHFIVLRFDDWTFGWADAAGAVGAMVLIPAAALAIGAAPYEGKYHHVYSLTGTVESVSNIIDEGSGEFTYYPVAELAEHDFPVVVNSARAASLVGSEVTFSCEAVWVHLAGDWYDCKIARVIQ